MTERDTDTGTPDTLKPDAFSHSAMISLYEKAIAASGTAVPSPRLEYSWCEWGNLCRSAVRRALRIAGMPDFDVQVDINYLAKVVTEVRDLAETVRTYGRAGASTIAAATPTALHVIAAYLESEMRSWAHTDGTHARLFNEKLGGEAIRFPELRAVLTYVTPSPVSREVQQAELRAAGARLRAVAQELPSRMTTQSIPKFVSLIEEQAATVMEFADGLG